MKRRSQKIDSNRNIANNREVMTIYDGKKSIDSITVFSSDLEENGIEAIKEVELKFHIYDVDSYSTIADTESITFSAQ